MHAETRGEKEWHEDACVTFNEETGSDPFVVSHWRLRLFGLLKLTEYVKLSPDKNTPTDVWEPSSGKMSNSLAWTRCFFQTKAWYTVSASSDKLNGDGQQRSTWLHLLDDPWSTPCWRATQRVSGSWKQTTYAVDPCLFSYGWVIHQKTRKNSSHLSDTHEPSHVSGHLKTKWPLGAASTKKEPKNLNQMTTWEKCHTLHPLFPKDVWTFKRWLNKFDRKLWRKTEPAGKIENTIAKYIDQRTKQNTTKLQERASRTCRSLKKLPR